MPAACSAWPTFALMPPRHNGLAAPASRRDFNTVAVSEPASIGSPSAVPVPCASFRVSTVGLMEPSVSAATIKPCCAWPLGAVRLADRPSCRTALPHSRSPSESSGTRIAIAPHASPRAYPSARASKVCERPRADVMPAMAKLVPICGVSMSVAPSMRPVSHSESCNARSPACAAASDAEHAVSYETHGPCSPITYESRPHAIDAAMPVAAYTLPPAGENARICAKSASAKPRKMPVGLPISIERSKVAPWSAS
eukprot:5220608-Prymnesium_polylepis.1